jgi:hypothetical protein
MSDLFKVDTGPISEPEGEERVGESDWFVILASPFCSQISRLAISCEEFTRIRCKKRAY